MSERFDSVLTYLPYHVKKILSQLPVNIKTKVHEIRLKTNIPVSLSTSDGVLFIHNDFSVNNITGDVVCDKEEIFSVFRALCGYSIHSHGEDIKNGFIPLKYGHRAGICGTAVVEKGLVTTFRDISSINIRISRQVIGVSDKVMADFNGKLYSAIICGSPGSGKTTLLRDIARRLSNSHRRVLVIDERFEISAMFDCAVQNDLGPCVDVISGLNKIDAIKMGIRTLSPDVIIVDEVASSNEASALIECFYCGVKIICTTHCNDIVDLTKKPFIRNMLKENLFERAIMLKSGQSNCTIERIYKSEEIPFENSWNTVT